MLYNKPPPHQKNKNKNHTCPIVFHNDSLNDAVVRIGVGKLVACGIESSKTIPGPTLETPWSTSDHHSYSGSPNLGTP